MEGPNDGWTLYSSIVPGYAERHGLRGIRARNARLLESFREASGQEEDLRIREALMENNRPLARYIAETWGAAIGWDRDGTDDAYQECCYALVGYLQKVPVEKLRSTSPWSFSVMIYYHMTARMQVLYGRPVRERAPETVPFDEERHLRNTAPVPDTEFITAFIQRIPLEKRKKDIFMLYHFGDMKRYVVPYCIEDITFLYGLSHGRTLQILKDATKRISAYTRQLIRRGVYSPLDFYKDPQP
jgi:hypothetical protein